MFATREQFGRGKLATELGHFEREIRGDYLTGVLSAADLTLYPMIALALRADLKNPALAIRTLVGPKLTTWMGRIEAPLFRPDPAAALEK
ncbi:MAG: hypothetical protein ACHBNF_14780 [Chromatiales bacterium]